MAKRVFRRLIVGVMGGSDADSTVISNAESIGRFVAARGWVLLTGGRNEGVMAAASRGAREGGGLVVGVLPSRYGEDAGPDVDLAICTDMGDGRNLLNVLSSDVVVALSGRMGTLSEIALALNAERPVVTLGHTLGPVFGPYRDAGLLVEVDSMSALESALAAAVEAVSLSS